MTTTVWDGTGELATDAAHYTTRDGQLRGRGYVRARVVRYLTRRWHWTYSAEQLARAVVATVDNDEWMITRNGYLVEAICREVVNHLLRGEL